MKLKTKQEQNAVVVENNGENSGAMVGINNGIINVNTSPRPSPSLLYPVIKAMAELDDSNLDSINEIRYPFKPEDKLDYNAVIKYRELFTEYAIYYTICSQIIDDFDNSNYGIKKKILRHIRDTYMITKGALLQEKKSEGLSDIEIIKQNSDSIIDSIYEKIYDIVVSSSDGQSTIEEIDIGIKCFLCYSFLECKILEKPK